ncbi:MAG: hypothetical protein ABS76_01695 [Pelagibacterium sp. SCN 64-44]|nr:MAG: hypothetical protein ABS76_01695 [Pelagibacterium sp. SCN 64-44]
MAMRLLLAIAGLVGAIGVAAAAGGSHGAESRNLGAIASICLAHGPALLALAILVERGRLFLLAGLLLAGGTLVFAGDLGLREWQGQGLFPGAAPLGGLGMILGWLSVVLAAWASRLVKN